MTLREHIAARMYLDYCRQHGQKQSNSDEEILALFNDHWMRLFATPQARENWLRRADVAIEAYKSFPSNPDLWTKNVEDLRGEMFFWARPNDRGGWGIGVGYWCKDGGWAGSETGRTGKEHLATRFHPFPDPPKD